MINEVRLIPCSANTEETKLKMYTSPMPFTPEGILSIAKNVYEDMPYRMVLEADKEYTNVKVFINGEEEDIYVRSNEITFTDNRLKGRIFKGRLGIVQLSVRVEEDGQHRKTYYSEHASIMVPDQEKHRNVTRMLDYVYENQDELLKGPMKQASGNGERGNTYADFKSQIRMLQEITQLYEMEYGYFRMSSRCKLKTEEVVDNAEKLQDVSSRTVQYIAQHPEYLRRSLSGIRYGKQTYLPDKTLMARNTISRDIYENQVILAFIKKVMIDARGIKKYLEDMLLKMKAGARPAEGYIVSLNLIYRNAEQKLTEYLAAVNEIESRLRKVYSAYQDILKVKEVDYITCPKATAIFMSVPQYKKIFGCMLRWFSKPAYDFENEQRLLSFMDVTMIYEVYTLARLVGEIKAQGFDMTVGRTFNYDPDPNARYRINGYRNTFEFTRGDQKLTLYYEPVIYDDYQYGSNDIGIFRNNSVSLGDDDDEVTHSGTCYVPDYLIKGEQDGVERYAVCDAKYSNLEKVKYKLMPKLTYKYIMSLSPMEDNAYIESLNVFYGLHDMNYDAESFYDMQGTRRIKPSVRIVPMSENVPDDRQEENLREVLNELFPEAMEEDTHTH